MKEASGGNTITYTPPTKKTQSKLVTMLKLTSRSARTNRYHQATRVDTMTLQSDLYEVKAREVRIELKKEYDQADFAKRNGINEMCGADSGY